MSRILVADDDADQTSMQRELLGALGYEVRTANSAITTLEELKRNQPDLILVDLRFPQSEDGLELIRAIRQTGCQVPLILLSGWPDDLYGSPEERMVSRVVVKGNIRELMQAIAELLAK